MAGSRNGSALSGDSGGVMKRTISMLVGLLFATVAVAGDRAATCSIEIQDIINDGTIYKDQHRFSSPKEDQIGAERKHFKLPGNDYVCTLAYFGRENGTMLSCEYKDAGWTFFQSDRSALPDTPPIANNLSFRHKSSQIYIETKCK